MKIIASITLITIINAHPIVIAIVDYISLHNISFNDLGHAFEVS